METITWAEFLLYLCAPNGISLAVGVVLSFLAEYIPPFEALHARWKRLVFLGACLAVPFLSSVLGILTVGWPWSWAQTFWPALVAGVIAFAGGTIAHTRKL